MAGLIKGLEKFVQLGRSEALLDRMAQLPPGYTHVGIANVELPGGVKELTVTAAGRGLEPMVFDPRLKQWRSLMVS